MPKTLYDLDVREAQHRTLFLNCDVGNKKKPIKNEKREMTKASLGVRYNKLYTAEADPTHRTNTLSDGAVWEEQIRRTDCPTAQSTIG